MVFGYITLIAIDNLSQTLLRYVGKLAYPMDRGEVSLSRSVALNRNIQETSEVGTSLYSGHFRWHQWCPHYRRSTVYNYKTY